MQILTESLLHYVLILIQNPPSPFWRLSFESHDSYGNHVAIPHILLIDSRTLVVLDTIQISQAQDIGGLYFHPQKQKLFGVERNSNLVFQMDWNPEEQTLIFEKLIFLSNMQYASGLVMDGDRAFVSEYRYGESMEYTDVSLD